MNHLLLEYFAEVEGFGLLIGEIDDILLFLFFDAPLHEPSGNVCESCDFVLVLVFEGGDEALQASANSVLALVHQVLGLPEEVSLYLGLDRCEGELFLYC